MTLLTIKEYAKKKNVSYEAVRKQIQRYKDDELKDHIIRKNKTQYLDGYAVDFLDNRRRESPIMVIQMDKDETIANLQQENDALIRKVAAQADRISELAQWKAENALAIAGAEQTRLLLTAAEEEKKALEHSLAEIEAQNAVLSAEKAEVEERARLESETAQKAAEALQRAEAEKSAWKEYAAALEAYNALGWFKRRRATRPTPPIEQEE